MSQPVQFIPPSDSPSASRDPFEGSVLEMILQRHRAVLTGGLIRTAVGRTAAIGAVGWIGWGGTVWTRRDVLIVLIGAGFFFVLWTAENWRQRLQLASLEELLGRRTGGRAEDLYIASRQALGFGLARRLPVLLSYEPLGWFVVIVIGLTLRWR